MLPRRAHSPFARADCQALLQHLRTGNAFLWKAWQIHVVCCRPMLPHGILREDSGHRMPCWQLQAGQLTGKNGFE